MKILFLSQEHPRFGRSGGIGSYVATMAKTLAARDHEVHVVVCKGQASTDVTEEGIHYHLRPSIPIRGLRYVSRLMLTHKRLSAAFSASRALKELQDVDVIESPEWMAESLFLSAKDRSRLVVHLHTPIGTIAKYGGHLGKDARLADALERKTIRRAACVTSPSNLLVSAIEGERPLHSQVKIVPLPVDVDFWARSSTAPPEREPMILFVGRLEQRKGPDVLIEAAALLPPHLQGTPVVAVGQSSGRKDGVDYIDWVRSLARARGVVFEHHDHVEQDELLAWYQRTRVLAVPSRFDSFSMVAAEGLAAGAPLVCTTGCGAAELIGKKAAGRVVPAGDPIAMRDALIPFLEDASLAEGWGRVGRLLIKERCSPDLVAAQRESIYQSVGS